MDDLRDRVEAVERALTDGEGDFSALAEGAAAAERVAALEDDVEDLREEVTEIAAATQALRGYVGNVRSVNESVEERADAALAAVESLENRLDERTETADANPTAGTPTGPATGSGLEARPGSAEPTRMGDGRSSSTHRGSCRACGRPTNTARAADGGRATAQETMEDPASGGGTGPPPTDASTTRRPLDGFDPNDAGERVTVRETSAADGGRSTDGSVAAGDSGDDTDGLVDRLRDRL